MVTFGIPRGILTISNLAPILLYNPECPELQIREIPNNLGGLNTEYLVTNKEEGKRNYGSECRMILLLVLEAGEVDSLKIFGPLCRRFFLVTGGGGGGWGAWLEYY